jgi:hypothetical protein
MKLSGLERIDAVGAVGRERFDAAIGYYERRSPSKRFVAKGLRAVALGMGMLASLVPLVVSFVFSVYLQGKAAQAKDWVGLSAIFAVVALGLVGIDRLFGFSSGWMRFVSVTLDLQARRSAFRVGWAKERHRAGRAPDDEHLLSCLDLLGASLAGIDDLVRAETQTWVTEFRGALAELDKSIAEQRSQLASVTPAERGAIEIYVANVAALDDRKFRLQLGALASIERSGASTAAIANLPPGIVKMTVSATMAGMPVSIERAVTVDAGKVTVIEMALT